MLSCASGSQCAESFGLKPCCALRARKQRLVDQLLIAEHDHACHPEATSPGTSAAREGVAGADTGQEEEPQRLVAHMQCTRSASEASRQPLAATQAAAHQRGALATHYRSNACGDAVRAACF